MKEFNDPRRDRVGIVRNREVEFSTAFDDYVAMYLSEYRKLVKKDPERARQIALKQLQDAGIVDAQGNVRSL